MLSINTEANMLLSLNEMIHKDNNLFQYHMEHIKLTRRYALLLNKRLSMRIDQRKLTYISLAHDLFKDRSLNKEKTVTWKGADIPQDLNLYVRKNMDILEEYQLGDYFNTDIQLHPLAAGLFLIKEFKIKDKAILYPVMFHSCPIISVYNELSKETQDIVDIIMLSDKLSSNYLKINTRSSKVPIDLELVVFGPSGHELNYTIGLYVARLLSQGGSTENQSRIATQYYYERLISVNPLMERKNPKKYLGEMKIWEPRKSRVLKMPQSFSEK